jgi:hypothetical protein
VVVDVVGVVIPWFAVLFGGLTALLAGAQVVNAARERHWGAVVGWCVIAGGFAGMVASAVWAVLVGHYPLILVVLWQMVVLGAPVVTVTTRRQHKQREDHARG